MNNDLENLRKKLIDSQAEQTKPNAKNSQVKQQKRLQRLEKMLEKLESGKDIQRRDLQNILTEEEWERFEIDNLSIGADEDLIGSCPAELDEYFALVKKGDFYHIRANATPVTKRSKIDNRNRNGKQRLRTQAESMYEKALELLSSILSACDSHAEYQIRAWLDRSVELDKPGQEPALDPISMPRKRDSRSTHSTAQNKSTKFDMKRENKKQALLHAIENLKENKLSNT